MTIEKQTMIQSLTTLVDDSPEIESGLYELISLNIDLTQNGSFLSFYFVIELFREPIWQ